MTVRAFRPRSSVPVLNLSSSSMTSKGMTTSLSVNMNRALGLWSRTLVSRTKCFMEWQHFRSRASSDNHLSGVRCVRMYHLIVQDSQLLDQFVRQGSRQAFETLVARYGGMVRAAA